jgi:phosphatidylserine decarboxylase
VSARRLAFVRALPRKAVSRAMGVLSSTPFPRALLAPAIAAYARGFGVDLSEAAPARYRSFRDFFARSLREGVRPLDPDPAAILCPVDGRVHAAGAIEAGSAVPVKGVPYSTPQLLGDAAEAAALEGGTFQAFYLSPRDYHRIHWPFDGVVEGVRHLPGDLWPVDPAAVDAVPRLFVRNERVAIAGRTPSGPFAMVAVGALNVGSVRLSFCRLRTNHDAATRPRRHAFDPPLPVRRGEDAGWFELGSAVVLACSPACGRLDALERGSPVRMGRSVGRLTSRA